MGFFLRKTWVWWLLAVALACFVSWLFCRWRARRGDAAELRALRQEAAEARAAATERQTRIDGLLAQRARDLDEIAGLKSAATGGAATLGGGALGLLGAAVAPPALTDEQLAAGAALLGIKLRADDLKVVEGVGPAIDELLQQGGIRTWHELSQAEPAALTAILEAAGPRFRVHDPASWPRQAGLLAAGEWQAFKDLCDQLTGGREG